MPKNDPNYMRTYQAERRKQLKEGQTPQVQVAVGNEIIKPGKYEAGHIHTWTRKLGEDTATCHGCEEVVKWKGRSLNPYTDGLADTSKLIQKTDDKFITKILNHPAINTNKRDR